MHAYVFWRLWNTPRVRRHISGRRFILIALGFWLSYPLSRMLEGNLPDLVVLPLEYAAANWVGFLFLLLSALLTADLLTLGGLLFRRRAPEIRQGAAVLALALGMIALVQGHRPPVLSEYEITLDKLPQERDGTVLVAISDLHLGTLIGSRWLQRTVNQVNAMQPDIIVAVGDVVDGNADRVTHLPSIMNQLKAPLGVWAVTGNHEYYAGVDACVEFFKASGMHVLRDQAEEVAPGLVLAGVDDLTARRQFGQRNDPVTTTLANKPEGATILLSHSPWQTDAAAKAGVDLMISGHTHKGQIWPFTYLVRTRYPLVSGLYNVEQMAVLVSRGSGTWGPRMRLWQPGEILKITLRTSAPAKNQTSAPFSAPNRK